MTVRANDDGAPNVVTYLFTDNFGNRIATLPLTGVSFTYALNGAGTFAGTLSVEDPRVAAANWLEATAVNLACVWVDIDGTLVWGGRVTKQDYDESAYTVQVGASDFVSYCTQRLQAKDYSTTWSTSADGAAQIAYTVLTDALASANSLPVAVASPAATPSEYQFTMALPLSQRMTVDAVMTQLAGMGWLIGFDYACDVAYVAGVPAATITFSYPRRGRLAGSTGLVLNTAAQHTSLRWPVDGTQQAMVIVEMATSAGGTNAQGSWEPAMVVDGYPLLDKLTSHTTFSTSTSPDTVLQAFVQNDLALYAYPVVTPVVTCPAFADPIIGSWIVGDDIRVIVPKRAGAGPGTSPRFPDGLDTYLRVTQASVTIKDQGLSTTAFTLNMPPSSTPQRPPL